MAKKILIVEDDISIRELLEELLISESYEVVTAAHGAEALEVLKGQELPHLILMDLMMPVLDGYGLRKELLKDSNWSSIPVVAMSAEASAAEKIKGYGVAAFLSKPVDIDTIFQTIEEFSS